MNLNQAKLAGLKAFEAGQGRAPALNQEFTKQAMNQAETKLDARIGQVMRNGSIVHYAFVNGYDADPIEGTRDEVEIALGLRGRSISKPAMPACTINRRPGRLTRIYLVTVTPRYTLYAGSWANHPYTVEVIADGRRAAIRREREAYNLENMGNPAAFRARLKPG